MDRSDGSRSSLHEAATLGNGYTRNDVSFSRQMQFALAEQLLQGDRSPQVSDHTWLRQRLGVIRSLGW